MEASHDLLFQCVIEVLGTNFDHVLYLWEAGRNKSRRAQGFVIQKVFDDQVPV